jgi:6-phospho-beta-glucosidase
VKGLVLAVKAYERAVIEAAISGSAVMARKAMLLYPPIGEWEPSKALIDDMIEHNSSLEYLRGMGNPAAK